MLLSPSEEAEHHLWSSKTGFQAFGFLNVSIRSMLYLKHKSILDLERLYDSFYCNQDITLILFIAFIDL